MPAKKTPRRKSVGRKKSSVPKKLSTKAIVTVRESGPRKWLFPILESAYTALAPHGAAVTRGLAGGKIRGAGKRALGTFRSHLQPGQGEDVLANPDDNFWVDRLREYKQRKAASFIARRARGLAKPGAVVPGAKNWSPLVRLLFRTDRRRDFRDPGPRKNSVGDDDRTVSAPYNPASTADAKWVALGS